MVLDLCFDALFFAGFVLDNEDRSVTRSDSYFKELFSRCGLHVYKSKVHHFFPYGSNVLKTGQIIELIKVLVHDLII